ncbi:MAG: type II toxin-antitoxin system HicB family antitoxin [Spirochaetales bacterium]|nr:type II toxin-antitoxin system HicB family antitoxin [Spirochaetales bacterium]
MITGIEKPKIKQYNQLTGENMHNEFTAILEKDGEWYIGYCPEIPGANGQGKTTAECIQNLKEAISLILEDRREDAMRGIPGNAIKEIVTL